MLSPTASADLVQATIHIAEEIAKEARHTVEGAVWSMRESRDQSLRLIANLADAICTLAVVIREAP